MIGIVGRLRKGLEKSRASIAKLVDHALGRGVMDEAAADELEESLILADVGPEIAAELVTSLKEWQREAGGGVTVETLREALSLRIARLLESESAPHTAAAAAPAPSVTLVAGVNGTGKTTTAAKLAAREKAEGRSVVLGAADTFRAAATEQLKIWGERIGVPVIAQAEGADPAAVAFDTVQAAIARKADRVFIDTAGRLHTKSNLMAELEKVLRVVRKLRENVDALLVLDATVGQNGLRQVQEFGRVLPLSGLVVTKLDGTARAGVVLSAVRALKRPVLYVGVGESVEDLLPFDPAEFATNLLK